MKLLAISVISIVTIIFAITKYTANSCYPGYVNINGNCIKEYTAETIKTPETGRNYFHKKFGIITLENNFWYDEDDNIIYELGER